MNILPGKLAENQKEATTLAFREAGAEGMDADINDMFTSLANDQKVSSEADKTVGTAIRNRYGSKATWRAERWFVPVPKLHYEGKDIPQLIIEITVYLVAAAAVRAQQDARLITLVGAIGKPETLAIPMIFLHALIESDLGRFAIVARDSVYTTWEVPGTKPVRIPNDFISDLSERLKWYSVVVWLGEFGTQGRCVAPLVAGSLLGLAFQDSAQPVPVNRQGFTTDDLVSALENMAYQPAEAREMVRLAAPRLRADMTLEEAIPDNVTNGKRRRLTMEQQFNAEEIKDAAKTARVYCPGFSEDDFESLMELERRIADSGYLEVIQGLLRLEEEKGISCTEALDACEKLTKRKAELERRVPDLEKRAESVVAKVKQANMEYEQVKKDIAKARQELEQIRNEYVSAEKKLEAFNGNAEKEKQRIKKDVQGCYQQANVTKEEVIAAGKVKAEVESHGFTLELALGLSKEFAGHKNARKEFAEGLKEYGSFHKYLDNLHDGANKERVRVIAEIAGLESQKKGLASENTRLGNALSQLQADIDGEQTLRQFYHRYAGYSGLLEKLAEWDHVYFMRCGDPAHVGAGMLLKKLGGPHFWTDKLPVSCPHCGYPITYFDTEIYQYLNWSAEVPFKLVLGE